MFRPMRRIKQQLSDEECFEILKNEWRGVLAVHGEDGYPYAFPMNFVFAEGKIYFHCAKEGHKLDAISANDKVSFCVYDKGFKKPGEWALNIKSVIIFGRIKKVSDVSEARRFAIALGKKYFPTQEELEKEIENSFDRVQMLELTIDHITGKLVNES